MDRLADILAGRISAHKTRYQMVLAENEETIERQRKRIRRQLSKGPVVNEGYIERHMETEEDIFGRPWLFDFVSGVRCPDIAGLAGRFPVVLDESASHHPLMIVPMRECKSCQYMSKHGGKPTCTLWPDEKMKWRLGGVIDAETNDGRAS